MKRKNDDCKGTTVRTKCALVLLAVLVAVGLTSPALGAGGLGSYLMLKGGVYSPSASFNLSNVDLENTFQGDTQSGVSGEVALGRYVLPTLALEVGAGYFQGKGSFNAASATIARPQVDFNVVPVLFSAKALIPAGRVAPYGELGIGAYFTKLDVGDNLNTFKGTTTFGLHTGAGLNVNITPNTFLGVEGRYVWANPSFGNQKITLNDREYALNGFALNGFTTTVALGFGF